MLFELITIVRCRYQYFCLSQNISYSYSYTLSFICNIKQKVSCSQFQLLSSTIIDVDMLFFIVGVLSHIMRKRRVRMCDVYRVILRICSMLYPNNANEIRSLFTLYNSEISSSATTLLTSRIHDSNNIGRGPFLHSLHIYPSHC